VVESPIGRLRVAATERGVVRIAFPSGVGSSFGGWLSRAVPAAEFVESSSLLDEACRELGEYFAGKRREFKVAVDLRGTEFQRAVWTELSRIPYGEVCTYADVARRIGREKAFRAVGAANGANPVPLIVPCHRVIASGGKLGGYGGGLDTKQRLLALERAESPLLRA
jgi:O-6-methylguanine DNA methyltransferase